MALLWLLGTQVVLAQLSVRMFKKWIEIPEAKCTPAPESKGSSSVEDDAKTAMQRSNDDTLVTEPNDTRV